MCLIILCNPGQRPSRDLLEQAIEANADGIGVAWSTPNGVAWRKGLRDNATVLETLALIPSSAYVMLHYRLATVGKASDALTHPFPLVRGIPVDLTGEAPAVLAHNGHWHDWKHALVFAGQRIEGEWSDSRALAFLAHRIGYSVLSRVNARTAILSKRGFKLTGNWTTYENVRVSNLYFRACYYSSETSYAPGVYKWSNENGWILKTETARDGYGSGPSIETQADRLRSDARVAWDREEKDRAERDRYASWWEEREEIENENRARFQAMTERREKARARFQCSSDTVAESMRADESPSYRLGME